MGQNGSIEPEKTWINPVVVELHHPPKHWVCNRNSRNDLKDHCSYHCTSTDQDSSIELGTTLQWTHNDHSGVSNHQSHGCLLNRLFRRRSKKTSKLRVTGHCAGNSLGPVNSPHKGPVTRKIVPFDDVIMNRSSSCGVTACKIFSAQWNAQPR